MSFSDFIDLKKGPESLVKLALCPLAVLIAGHLVLTLLSQLSTVDLLLIFLLLTFTSPLAYLIRKHREGHMPAQGRRRGAERTPLLPPDEEDE
jgi:hypothetical protein